MAKAKEVQSIETRDGVTTITYTDGSVEVRHGGGAFQVGTVHGGISMS